MTDLEALTADDFEPLVGTVFTAANVPLALATVTRHAPGGRTTRPSFSLTFTGPRSPFLAQGTYGLTHDTRGRLDLFLVPIGITDTAFEYEAVFG